MRQAEFNASKDDVACLFLKIERNPTITLATGNGNWVTRLTSRSTHIAVPILVEIPEFSLVTIQES